ASVFLICAIWSLVALPGRVAQSTISGWAGGPVYDFGVPHPSRFCSGGVVPGSSLAAAFPSAPAAVPSTPIQSPPCPPPRQVVLEATRTKVSQFGNQQNYCS